jgi:NADH:ubiquinone oxidoreductase subunit 6 (subunit J)
VKTPFKKEKITLKGNSVMKKDHLYLYTFLGLAVIVTAVSYFSMQFLFEVSTNQFLKSHIESGKREANDISNLVQFQLESGLTKEQVIHNLQKSIESKSPQSQFISMLDWSGNQICHPNPEKLGTQIVADESFLQPVYSEIAPETLYDLLTNKHENKQGGLAEEIDADTEVIYLYPVKNTDWIIAAHANTKLIKEGMQQLKVNFILVYTSAGILVVLLSLMMVRLISRQYEKTLEIKNEGLSKEVLTLSKLNSNLVSYKEKVDPKSPKHRDKEESESEIHSKKRILTYVKDFLIAIDTHEIRFIYTENTITYICCQDGKVYNSTGSLDELYKDLDKTIFFRANRQFILSISAISKIYKYGNNQLKIELTQRSPIPIIVSKNKAAEFKNWLSS